MIVETVSAARISRIRVAGLRNLDEVEAELGPGFNFFRGANGAGKTSLLEAVHLLAHGRSFRGGSTDALIQRGRERFSIFGEVGSGPAGAVTRERLGMAFGTEGWTLRHNDRAVASLSEFVRVSAVVTLEPTSHELIAGSSEPRRRFLDWLLFHVEPGFLEVWRRYMRALRQRNASLRRSAGEAELEGWEIELGRAGEVIHAQREALLTAFRPLLGPLVDAIAPGIELRGVRFRSGWPAGLSLAEALAEGRSADRERGFTQRGPHRGDWRLEFVSGLDHGQLSRGQAKLAAFVCLLAQARLYQLRTSCWPVLCCDDLAAELDPDHQGRLIAWLGGTGAQVLVTGTLAPAALDRDHATRMFHVEQGRLSQLV